MDLVVALLRASDMESHTDWWQRNAPLLQKIMGHERYPVSGRVRQAVGGAYNAPADPHGAFEFGLERVIDGIVGYLDRNNGRRREQPGKPAHTAYSSR